MTNKLGFFLCIASFSLSAAAALEPHSIPRASSQNFRAEGLFEGGSSSRANLESLRLASHAREGFERWVIDFSDEQTRRVGLVAPRFQLRYVHGEKLRLGDGREIERRPAKFIFVFRSIDHCFLAQETAAKLARKSQFVKNIILYPPIEKGDMAMEFILKDNVLFEPHQPVEKEGRLVLDMKSAPKVAHAGH